MKKDPDAAGAILALLEQLKCDDDLIDRLTQTDYGKYRDQDFSVGPVWQEQKKGRNIWRLKIWDLEDQGLKYRVIYGYTGRPKKYHVYAVVHRDFDYAEEHPITKRVRDAFDDT